MSKTNNNKSKKIYFFYPHDAVISGGLFYFYSLANNIPLNSDYKTFIVNHKNSKYTEIFCKSHSDIRFSLIDYKNRINLPKNESFIIFTQVHFLYMALEYFREYKNARIFLIDIHPETQNYLLGNLSIKKSNIKNELFQMLNKNNSVGFMDKSCLYEMNKTSALSFGENYIPAYIENMNPQYENSQIISQDEINIGCVCRLDSDKIQTVINLLNNLSNIKTSKKINLHLIGNGNRAHLIKKENYENKINIKFLSYLYGEELKQYARDNFDIAINFGIAALDLASQKLPVAVPVYEQNQHKIDKYTFLFDMPDYILGCKKHFYNLYDIKTYTLQEIIDDIYRDENKKILGEKCYIHTQQNHLVEFAVKKLLEHCENTTLTVGACLKKKFLSKPVYSFYKARKNNFDWNLYCKNGKSHNVLGIKLKVLWYALQLSLFTLIKPKKLEKIQIKLNDKLEIIKSLKEQNEQ